MNTDITCYEFAALHFRCPVTQRRLLEAVFIIPCGCRVNHEAVEKVKVMADKIFTAIENTSCPACSKQMIGYCEDFSTRKDVQIFFDTLGKDKYKLTNIPKEKTKRIEGPVIYPGERGVFVKTSKPKSPFKCFQSQNNSAIQAITFVCNSQFYHLFIRFQRDSAHDLWNVLRASEIEMDDGSRIKGSFLIDQPNEMEKLFNLLISYNDFPQEDAMVIHQMIKDHSNAKIKERVIIA